MRTISCVAVDDEPMALSVISNFCKRAGGNTLAVFTDPDDAFRHISGSRPDLVFLDIEMGTVSGLDIARRLPEGILVIFTTAYKQYALDGYDIGVVDFLHKPFSYSRFEKAMEKVRMLVEFKHAGTYSQVLMVKEDYTNVSIPFNDIMYIEAMNNYCRIFRSNGHCTNSRISLKALASSLPEKEFIRVHRSFVVSRSRIVRYSGKEICLSSGHVIPVGRQYSISDIMQTF